MQYCSTIVQNIKILIQFIEIRNVDYVSLEAQYSFSSYECGRSVSRRL